MPKIQAATTLPWQDAAGVQAATTLPWQDAAGMQSIGSAYTSPLGPGATTSPGGALAPTRDILPQSAYVQNVALSVIDLRDSSVLPVTSVTLDLSDGSDMWTLQAQGTGALATALLAGEQPATVEVSVGTDKWRFVVEEVDQPLSFGSQSVTVRGRSLASAAGSPYQVQESWLADSTTTAAQVCTLANTFSGVTIDWRVPDWVVPAGAWSATTDPLGVVRQFAAAVRADVEAHQSDLKITVRSRYAIAPNLWASSAPDVQIPWEAVEFARQERMDQPAYDAVLVAGQSTGGTLIARLAGTSGARQAPMVTDALLTDAPAMTELATALLYGYGGKARETRTIQMHGGVITRGSLVRCVEPSTTWSGVVRSVSVSATFDKARQTLGIERPTSFPSGYVEEAPVCVPVPYGYFEETEVFNELFPDGIASYATDTGNRAVYSLESGPYGETLVSATQTAATAAVIRRSLTRGRHRRWTFYVNVTSSAASEATSVYLLSLSPLAGTWVFTPRMSSSSDAARRPIFYWRNGPGETQTPVTIGSAALALGQWHFVEVFFSVDSLLLRITNTETGEVVVSQTISTGTAAPPLSDGMQFTNPGGSVATSPTKYAAMRAYGLPARAALVLHGDAFSDKSLVPKTVTTSGTVTIDSTVPGNDVSSFKFVGTGGRIIVADNAGLEPRSEDFTIRFRVRFNNVTNVLYNLFGKRESENYGTFSIIFDTRPGLGVGIQARFDDSGAGGWLVDLRGISGLLANTWYDYEVTRQRGVFRHFIQGKLSASQTISDNVALMADSSNAYVGARSDGTIPLDGNLQGLLYVIGDTLHTSDFEPSPLPYCRPA